MKVVDVKFIIRELKRAKEYNDKYQYADLHCVLINCWVFYNKTKSKKHRDFYTLFERRIKLLIRLNVALITKRECFKKKETRKNIDIFLSTLISNCNDELEKI